MGIGIQARPASMNPIQLCEKGLAFCRAENTTRAFSSGGGGYYRRLFSIRGKREGARRGFPRSYKQVLGALLISGSALQPVL